MAMYTMAVIKDNSSLDFLPNYVMLKNSTKIDKAEYVDMAIRTEAYIRSNGRLPAIVYRMSKLPDYSDSTMKLFIKTFNYKGNTIDEALAIAKYAPKASSEIIEKLLKSAIANAENNHHMAHEKLYVAEIYANQGPTLKRIRPAAKGSAVRIRKRTSHITIVLKERD